jgi:hypothetical protein
LEEDYQESEKHLLYVLFGPLFAHLMGEKLSSINISEVLEQWDNAITQHQNDFLFAKDWKKVIQFYGELFQLWKDGHEIDVEFEIFDNKTTFELFKF